MHLWQYESLAQRQRVREALVKDAPWMNEYMARMRPMLQRQENLLLRPLLPMQTFGKAPSAPPAPEVTAASGPVVYELKFHAIAPAEWVRLYVGLLLRSRASVSMPEGVWLCGCVLTYSCRGARSPGARSTAMQ